MLIALVIGGLLTSSGGARLQLWTKAEKGLEEVEELPVTTYEVEKGDSLWKIADSVYGDPYKWRIFS